ncbi:MAG TPA: hypothetical protein VNX68_16485, partial [Nitrosopumilaceae archaeon]|nr:hypothetical protein [Nitrosopumilaceae archaeon]
MIPGRKNVNIPLVLLLVLSFCCVYGQKDKPTADELFYANNHLQALEEYLKLEKQFPEEPEIKHRIGTCYLKIHDDKTRAIPYLEYCY